MSLIFFNDTATTEIYALSLHDALPISAHRAGQPGARVHRQPGALLALHRRGLLADLTLQRVGQRGDRKSTRLNSSHANISYAVFCLKKKQNPPLSHSSPFTKLPLPWCV